MVYAPVMYHLKLQSKATLLWYRFYKLLYCSKYSGHASVCSHKTWFYEPSDSQRAEKEAINVQLQEKNTEIEKLKRDLQAMRVSSL